MVPQDLVESDPERHLTDCVGQQTPPRSFIGNTGYRVLTVSEELKNVTATVKWFKTDKGFGFVRFADGSGEAFLHSSVLAPLGDVSLIEGTILVCDVVEGPKGRQVSAVHSVTPGAPPEPKPRREPRARRQRPEGAEPGAPAPAGERAPERSGERPPRPARFEPAPRVPLGPEHVSYGTVRWYNLDSQSGLIDPWDDETGVGVYFDRATLRQSGLDVVADGEDVRFVAQRGENGPFAVRVELA